MRNPRKLLSKALLIVMAIPAVSWAQQSPPALQITSPTEGTIVNPGQTISVTVTSSGNDTFLHVGVIGEDPIGFSNDATSLPAEFSITIPKDIRPGKYMLTAVGVTSARQMQASETILIDVERPDLPIELEAQMPSITFAALGEQLPLVILAKASDGSVLDVSESSNVTYSTSNPGVATVDARMVTAKGVGHASITVTYTQNGQSIHTTIPVSLLNQTLSITPTTLDFGSQNVGSSTAPQQLTATNARGDGLEIISVAAVGDFSETDDCVTSSPLREGGSCTITVTFRPRATGSRYGHITIANRFDSIPSVISLTGMGTAP